MRLALMIIIIIFSFINLQAQNYFPTPKFGTPSINGLNPSISLFNSYKNEVVDQSSLDLNIINSDVTIAGRGLLSLSLERCYSSRDSFKNQRDPSAVQSYVNLLYEQNENFSYHMRGFIQCVTGRDFSDILSDTDIQTEFENSLLKQQEIFSFSDFINNTEKTFGDEWFLSINSFSKIYCLDSYIERWNDDDEYDCNDPGNAPKKFGTWRHDRYIISSQGIINYYREQEYELPSQTPAQVADGQYSSDLDSKNFVLTYDGSQYILKTKNGLRYIYSLIKSGIYDGVTSFADGEITFEGHKKIAYLTEIQDKYGNVLTINYNDLSYPYRITGLTLVGIPSMGFADRNVNIIYDPTSGHITEIRFSGDTGLLSWNYSYIGGKLESATDPLQPAGRTTHYEYISDGSYHNGILYKVIYPNSSYTVYEYDRELKGYNAAQDAITDMLLPYSKRIVKARIRYDVDPSDNTVKSSFKTEFLKTVRYIGNDDDENGLIDSYEYLGSRVVVGTELDPPVETYEYHDTYYEYNSDNLLETVTSAIELDGLDSRLYYYYSSDCPIPTKIEEYIIPESMAQQKIKKVEYSYDAHFNPNSERIYMANNAAPELVNDYDYIYDTTTKPGFILNYLEQKVTKNGNETIILKKSHGVFDTTYKDLIELYQRLDGTDILMTKYHYKSDNAWQIDYIEQRLDNSRWITTTYEYDTVKGVFITKKLQTINDIDLESNFEYNIESGTLKKIIDENNNITEIIVFDTLNRPLEIINPSGIIKTISYDDLNNGMSTSTSDGIDNITTIEKKYTGFGIIEEDKFIDHTQTPEQITEKNYVYYKVGTLKKEIINEGDPQYQRIIRYWYDILGRIVRIEPPDNSEVYYEYNYNFNEKVYIKKIKNIAGQENNYYRDFLGKLIKIEKKNSISSDIYQTKYIYDLLGSLTEVWENSNDADATKILKTYYGYNNFGRNIWVKYPYDYPNISESYQYTYHGKIKKRIDKQGNESIYDYDDIGRLISIIYPNPLKTGNMTLEYDNGLYGKGKLTKTISSKSGYIEYEYAQFNRLNKLKHFILPLDKIYEIEYGYNILGNATSIKIPGNSGFKLINYIYDGWGKLLNVEYNGDILAKYKYDKLGHLIEKKYNNENLHTDYKYDSGERIKEISSYNVNTPDEKIFYEKYIYDIVGNRKITIDANKIWTFYNYDPVQNMLKKVNYGLGKEIIYEYDKLYNRTKVNYAYGSIDYNYMNNSHKIDNYLLNNDPNIEVNLSYDYKGNTINEEFKKNTIVKREKIYEWDDKNRLIRFENNINTENTVPSLSISANYLYNPNGMRIMKEVNGKSKYYIYNNANQIIAELDEVGNVKNTFIYGLGKLCRIDESDNIFYFFYDILGSIRKITDSNGQVLQTYKYGPYGNIEYSKGKVNNSYRYNGKEFDLESGLYYYGARYYNPGTGFWINEDPIIADLYNIKDLNPYLFCYNNSLKYRDIAGTFAFPFTVGWQGLLIGAGAGYLTRGLVYQKWGYEKEGLDLILSGALLGWSIQNVFYSMGETADWMIGKTKAELKWNFYLSHIIPLGTVLGVIGYWAVEEKEDRPLAAIGGFLLGASLGAGWAYLVTSYGETFWEATGIGGKKLTEWEMTESGERVIKSLENVDYSRWFASMGRDPNVTLATDFTLMNIFTFGSIGLVSINYMSYSIYKEIDKRNRH